MRRVVCLPLLVGFAILGTWGVEAGAQEPVVRAEVFAHPSTVTPLGGNVDHFIGLVFGQEMDEPVTITSIASDVFGDLADPANDALTGTSCSVPATWEPNQYVGAYDWGCHAVVWLDGEPGVVSHTITAAVQFADGTDAAASATVVLAISSEVGGIRGTITDGATGEPIADVNVDAIGGIASGSDFTDSSGRFSIEALPPGEYRLLSGNSEHFPSIYAREWWDGAPRFDSAGVVAVAPGELTSVEWSLDIGGVITGTVTDESSDMPLAGVSVSYVRIEPGGGRSGPFGGYTTDNQGIYVLPGLQTADYLVCFYDFTAAYRPECWDDRVTIGTGLDAITGDAVPVGVGSVVEGIDATLQTERGAGDGGADDPEPPEGLPYTGAPTGVAAVIASIVLVAGCSSIWASRRMGDEHQGP